MLPRLRFFVEQALSGLWRSLGVSVLAIITIGIALGLLATFVIVLENLHRLLDELGDEVEISAYLERGIPEAKVSAAVAEIGGLDGVAKVTFRSSRDAFAEFGASLGKDQVLLEGLPEDILPPSIEVLLASEEWSTAAVRALAARLEQVPGVVDVRYGQEDLERLAALLAFVRVAAVAIGAVLCLAVVFLVSNTIRLTVYARKDEIEIMSLIGATDAFVRAPFVIEGAIQGALGAIFAAVGLGALQGALTAGIERGLSYAYGPVELEIVPIELLFVLLGFGVVLGLLGSLLAVGKFVRV